MGRHGGFSLVKIFIGVKKLVKYVLGSVFLPIFF